VAFFIFFDFPGMASNIKYYQFKVFNTKFSSEKMTDNTEKKGVNLKFRKTLN